MESKPLHILLLCSWYPNPESKSNGIFIKRHAEALATQHHVTVLFAKGLDGMPNTGKYSYQKGQLTEHTHFYPRFQYPIPLIGTSIKLLRFWRVYKQLIDDVSKHASFDVIHVNTIFPAAIPALYAAYKYPKARLFVTEHWSGYYPEDANYRGLFMTWLTRKIVKKASAVFVISTQLKTAMQSHQLQARYELIANVVDTAVFKPKDNLVPSDILKILHVSSLVNREKNIEGIISVAEQLRDRNKPYCLTIVGENKLEIERYRKLLNEKKLTQQVIFVGHKTPLEVAEYMNQADVFLLFSHFEGMPVVLLESLACGTPVITTPVGAVKEMIPQSMGCILKAHSVAECVDRLIQFNRNHYCSSKDMHEHIQQHYSKEAVCHSITTLYRKYAANA